jgi:hypothetical protein
MSVLSRKNLFKNRAILLIVLLYRSSMNTYSWKVADINRQFSTGWIGPLPIRRLREKLSFKEDAVVLARISHRAADLLVPAVGARLRAASEQV